MLSISRNRSNARRACGAGLALLGSLVLAACGGGGGGGGGGTTTKYTVGGTVSGLASGDSVVLQDSVSGDTLTVSANGSYSFTVQIASGTNYNVTVKTQPTGPAQTCSVASGSGTISANVTNVAVTCTTNSYTIGGSVSGLSGSGLVLEDNGGDDLTVSGSSFTFATPVASGATYMVTVKTQPSNPTQMCTVGSDTGTVSNANVTSVTVTCTTPTVPMYSIGGSVSGLSGSGLVLQDNGKENLPVAAAATSFTFSTQLASGAAYSVTVGTQPTNPSQTCSVTGGGSGTVAGANVTSVQVGCTTNTYTISGNVTGLATGATVTLKNGGDTLPVTGNGSFTFPTSVASGATYAVTVTGQPTSPYQTCTVSGGSGTVGSGAVSGVSVSCVTNTYTVSANVTGLSGTGLKLASGADTLTISANGTYPFPTKVASGVTPVVTVAQQPTSPAQTCTVTAGTPIANAPETIAVSCSAFTISATVTGLAPGQSVSLQDNANAADTLTFTAGGTATQSFATKLAGGATYAVTVSTQPVSVYQGNLIAQYCTVAPATGTVSAATTVQVTCRNTGEIIYLTTSNPGNVSTPKGAIQVLYVDPTSGVLYDNGNAFATSQSQPEGIQVDQNEGYAFVAFSNPNGGSGATIEVMPINPNNDKPTELGSTTLPLNTTCGSCSASQLLLDSSGNYLWAGIQDGNPNDHGYLGLYFIQPNITNDKESLVETYGSPYGLDKHVDAIAIDPADQYVFITNTGSQTVGMYQNQAGASNTNNANSDIPLVTDMPFMTNGAAGTPSAVAVYPQPAGAPSISVIYVTDSANNTVNAYSYTASGLTAVGSYATGTNPQAVAVDPAGRFVYVVNATDATNGISVSAYSINPATGALTSLGAVIGTGAASSTAPVSIQVDFSGQFVYVANGSEATMTAFAINQTTGASYGTLTLINKYPSISSDPLGTDFNASYFAMY